MRSWILSHGQLASSLQHHWWSREAVHGFFLQHHCDSVALSCCYFTVSLHWGINVVMPQGLTVALHCPVIACGTSNPRIWVHKTSVTGWTHWWYWWWMPKLPVDAAQNSSLLMVHSGWAGFVQMPSARHTAWTSVSRAFSWWYLVWHSPFPASTCSFSVGLSFLHVHSLSYLSIVCPFLLVPVCSSSVSHLISSIGLQVHVGSPFRSGRCSHSASI